MVSQLLVARPEAALLYDNDWHLPKLDNFPAAVTLPAIAAVAAAAARGRRLLAFAEWNRARYNL